MAAIVILVSNLLPNLDPLGGGRDRELLMPDPAVAVAGEAARLAPFRGAETAELAWT